MHSIRGVQRSVLMAGFVVLGSCGVPLLESQFEHGPTVSDVVNHINCELADVVSKKNPALIERVERMGEPLSELDKLTKYHFVASVLMTLDVLDSESANPTFNFITPLYSPTRPQQPSQGARSLHGHS